MGRVLQTLRGHDLSGQGQGSSEGAKDGCFAFFSVVKASRYPHKLQSSIEESIYYLSLSLEDHLWAPGLLPLLLQDRIQTCVTGRMFLAVLKKKDCKTQIPASTSGMYSVAPPGGCFSSFLVRLVLELFL